MKMKIAMEAENHYKNEKLGKRKQNSGKSSKKVLNDLRKGKNLKWHRKMCIIRSQIKIQQQCCCCEKNRRGIVKRNWPFISQQV